MIPVVETLRFHVAENLRRQGEASNPGPEIWLGAANPTGIRGKEAILSDLPYGLWGITETHLSGINMRPVVATLKRWGKDRQRRLQCLPGAPLPLRARSQTAGIWAGVLTMTDLLPRELNSNWPGNEYKQGRVQLLQAWSGPYALTGACLYGSAKSPTWPNALRDTNAMFDTVVQ